MIKCILSCVSMLSLSNTGIPKSGFLTIFLFWRILSNESAIVNASGLIVKTELRLGPDWSIEFILSI